MLGKKRKHQELCEVFHRIFSILDLDYEQFNMLFPIKEDNLCYKEFEFLSKKYGCPLGIRVEGKYYISTVGICNLISTVCISKPIQFFVDKEKDFFKITYLKDK